MSHVTHSEPGLPMVVHLETAFGDEKAHGYDSLASVLARPGMSKPY